jgi:hypothetical protein
MGTQTVGFRYWLVLCVSVGVLVTQTKMCIERIGGGHGSYLANNDPLSAYGGHILNNGHEHRPTGSMSLLKRVSGGLFWTPLHSFASSCIPIIINLPPASVLAHATHCAQLHHACTWPSLVGVRRTVRIVLLCAVLIDCHYVCRLASCWRHSCCAAFQFFVFARLRILTLCRSYLNPYCLGRKTAFFSVGI